MARIRIEASADSPRDTKVIDTATGADLTNVIRAVDIRIGPETCHFPVVRLELTPTAAEIVIDGEVITTPPELTQFFQNLQADIAEFDKEWAKRKAANERAQSTAGMSRIGALTGRRNRM